MAISNDGPRQLQEIFASRPGGRLTDQQAVLLNALLGRERFVSYETLAEVLWGNDPDGGPLNTKNHIRAILTVLRFEIAASGIPWSIENVYGIGYRLRYLRPNDAALAA